QARGDQRTTGGGAGPGSVREVLGSGVIERRRSKQNRLAAEDDDSHAVIPEPAEKIMDDALDRVDLRGAAETALGHRPRRVEDQDDVDPFRDRLDRGAHELRSRERHDEGYESENAYEDEDPSPAHAPARRPSTNKSER